ncbi:recombinase family protein, partial [Xanthomonas campestris]
MVLIGYARVSTAEQDTALQTDALRKAGCARVFEDTASGAKADRPGLADALAYLRAGDVLAVWRLDRLGRSMQHLIETIAALEARGVGFRSLTESI